MKMPQDFIDAINEAVLAVNPDCQRTMTGGSFTLGSDFDEFTGPEALKYGLGPLPDEVQARFEALWGEKRDGIKQAMVDSAVEMERKLMAGHDFRKESDDFLAKDKAMCEAKREALFGKPVDGVYPRSLSEVMERLAAGDFEEVDPMTADDTLT